MGLLDGIVKGLADTGLHKPNGFVRNVEPKYRRVTASVTSVERK
jgi:hypothetical protein